MSSYPILSDKTQEILGISRLLAELEAIIPDEAKGLLRGRKQDHPAGRATPQRAVDAADQAVEEMRQRLLDVVHKLDGRIAESLSRNNASMVIRYLFLTILGVLVVAAIIIAMATQTITWGVLGGLVPLPLVGFLLHKLRGLQDERVALLLRFARHEPRIVTCSEINCLQDVAREISLDLEWLNALGSHQTDARAP
jgi:hypothetical protein